MFDFLYKKYENVKDAVILYRNNGDVKYINDSGLKLFKYPTGLKPITVFELMDNQQAMLHKNRVKYNKLGMRNRNIKAVCYDLTEILVDIAIIPGNILLIKPSIEEKMEEYFKFFNTNSLPMMISDTKGKISNVNNSFCLSMGYTKEKLIGKNFLDFVDYRDMDKTIKAMKDLSITKKIIGFENRYINWEGDIVYFLWDVIQEDGKNYCSCENITEKIRIKVDLYKTHQYLEEIENITRLGYWEWCVPSGELVWSDGLKDIYQLYEPTYETYMACNHEQDVENIKKTIEKCLIDKKKYTMTHRIIRNKSKEVLWVKAVGKIIIKDDKEYLIGVLQDITDEYILKETYKIEKEKAVESSSIKSKFVSSVSHELRTPLNGIIGMVSLLNTTETTEKQKQYIKVLDSSCGVLLSIINNILDFSKIESGKISVDYNSFNIEKSVKDIVELFKPSAMSKGLKIDFSVKKDVDTIMSDEIKIKQILSNLISNAIKFTKNGNVFVDVNLQSESLKIQVKDTGKGISSIFLKTILEPFTQENSNSINGGSGLGMSIIKSYLDILKGSINIESELSIGTIVKVTIPVLKSDYKKVIVVIEDNYANSFILKEMISTMTGYIVEVYEDGKDYIDNADKIQPLLIFMDLHMPILDGISTTKHLRHIGYTCPIVAVTANNLKSEKIKGYEAGITDFIIKPVSISEITNCFSRYIKEHLNTKL